MKLLIVEDEERTRELLRQYIAWPDIGVHEVETARNGKLALQTTERWSPDIVLCDVRMPKMDGIELAAQLRASGSECKIIFLSGYSDKEYLKSALHLKATAYLEKPINLDEVRRTVAEAVRIHAKESRKAQEDRQLLDSIDHTMPYLRQEWVRHLIASGVMPEQSPDTLSRNAQLPMRGPYTVLCATFHGSSPNQPEDPATMQDRLLFQCNDNAFLQDRGALCGFDREHRLVAVLPGAYGSAYTQNRQIIELLLTEWRSMAGPACRIMLSVGEPAAELASIPHSYATACEAGCLQFYSDGRRPIFADRLGDHQPLAVDWEIIRELRDSLRRGDIPQAAQVIRACKEQAMAHRDLDLSRVKGVFSQLRLSMLEIAVEQGLTAHSIHNDAVHSTWQEMDRIPLLDELESCLLACLQPFADRHSQMDGMSSKLREIVRYIHAHYHEKGFSIQRIAAHVQLSETYLCAIFKKQQGRTLKDYITELRMTKGKELLLNKNIKLFEVAIQLGFTDPNYFATAFKRCTGMTPSEYRDKVAP